jgi:hypothetical protein
MNNNQSNINARTFESNLLRIKLLIRKHFQAQRLNNFDQEFNQRLRLSRCFKPIEDKLFLEANRLIRQDSELFNRKRLLMQVQGIGDRFSTYLVLELPQLGRMNSKQLKSYIGFPSSKTIREKRNSPRLKQVRAIFRNMLPSIIQHNQEFREFYANNEGEVNSTRAISRLIMICNDKLKDFH